MINKHSLSLFAFILLIGTSCTYTKLDPIILCDETIEIILVEKDGTDCSTSNGFLDISASVSSDQNDFEYSIDGTNFQTATRFEGLSAGSYEITARTAEGCDAKQTFQIENKSGLNIQVTATDSNCDDPSGTIQVQASDFSGTVTYQLDDNQAQDNASFSALEPGTYMLTVRDDANCEVVQTVEVASNLGLEQIKQILNTSCVNSSCHGGNQEPDFREDDNIIEFRDRIMARTTAGTMPPASSGTTLEQSAIDDIACWVENFQ